MARSHSAAQLSALPASRARRACGASLPCSSCPPSAPAPVAILQCPHQGPHLQSRCWDRWGHQGPSLLALACGSEHACARPHGAAKLLLAPSAALETAAALRHLHAKHYSRQISVHYFVSSHSSVNAGSPCAVSTSTYARPLACINHRAHRAMATREVQRRHTVSQHTVYDAPATELQSMCCASHT